MTLVNDPMDAYPDDAAAPWATPFTRYGPDRLLVVLAGLSAIAFGVLLFVLQLTGEAFPRALTGFTSFGGSIFTFAVALVFGLLLLLAFTKMGPQPAEGSVVALAFAIVLLVFGGTAGMVGGILGLVGSVFGLIRNVKWPA